MRTKTTFVWCLLELKVCVVSRSDVRRPFQSEMLASQGVTMALFPLHFFFTALYYTDTGSTLLVIGAHLMALRRAYLAAGLAAAAATSFRQTNAVWAAFTLAVRRVAPCEGVKQSDRQSYFPGTKHVSLHNMTDTDGSLTHESAPLCTVQVAVMQECAESTAQPSSQSLRVEIQRTFTAAWHRKAQLAGRLWPLAAVPAAFAAFVLSNGGVVVGDRSAHMPVKHLMQPLHFFAFSAMALAPVLLRPSR